MDAIDTEVPGLLEGLYLTGSAALGDFQAAGVAGRSSMAATP